MKLGISVKLDVTKIDKSRIFEGKKGKYLDLTTFVDLDNLDEYGNNGFISQSVSKDEQSSGVKTPILGNVKVFWQGDSNQPSNAGGSAASNDGFDDSIPFLPFEHKSVI